MKKALVVLSGGQDSTTCLFWASARYERVRALTFNYGQRHLREIEAARHVATMVGNIEAHDIVELGPVLRGASPLVDHGLPLETYQDYPSMDKIIGDRVELTFVPMRNALFLTIAINRAVSAGCEAVVTGVCQQDNANYPDCRQPFIDAMHRMSAEALGMQAPRIETPLMNLSKAESIKLAKSIPGCYEALAWTHTAYDGQYPPNGKDHASTLRAQGFLEAGVPDPLVVRAWKAGLMALPATPNYAELAS